MAWNPFLGAQTARGYARARPDYHPQAVTVAARLLELDRPVETAADLGCGTGMSTRALRAIAAHVIGFDVSHPMLLAAEALPGVSYARAAAEQLPLQSQSCTASYSISWPTSCHPAVLSLRSSLDRSGAVGAARPPDPDVSRQSHSQDRDRPAVVQITTSTGNTPSPSRTCPATASAPCATPTHTPRTRTGGTRRTGSGPRAGGSGTGVQRPVDGATPHTQRPGDLGHGHILRAVLGPGQRDLIRGQLGRAPALPAPGPVRREGCVRGRDRPSAGCGAWHRLPGAGRRSLTRRPGARYLFSSSHPSSSSSSVRASGSRRVRMPLLGRSGTVKEYFPWTLNWALMNGLRRATSSARTG